MRPLSKRMVEALRNLSVYGDYELMEMTQWSWWQVIARSEYGVSNIRTDTMQGLVRRGLAQIKYDRKRVLCKYIATLSENGIKMAQTVNKASQGGEGEDGVRFMDWFIQNKSFPVDRGKRIYLNVQYYAPGQSIDKPPVWDKTVYITDNAAGRRLVHDFTHSLVEHVAGMQISDHVEVTLTSV